MFISFSLFLRLYFLARRKYVAHVLHEKNFKHLTIIPIFLPLFSPPMVEFRLGAWVFFNEYSPSRSVQSGKRLPSEFLNGSFALHIKFHKVSTNAECKSMRNCSCNFPDKIHTHLQGSASINRKIQLIVFSPCPYQRSKTIIC